MTTGVGSWGSRLVPMAGLVAAGWLVLQVGMGLVNGQGATWDFANFYDAGHKVVAGETANLYDATVPIDGKPPQADMPFFGTPLSALVYAPLAWWTPPTALVLFKAAGTVAMVAGIALLFQLYRRRSGGEPGSASVFVVATVLFQPFWDIYHIGGQSTPFVFLLVVLALRAFVEDRDRAAGAWMAVAVAIKPAFALVFILLLLHGNRTLRVAAVGAGLGLAALSVRWTGWEVHELFLARIADTKPESWQNNSSLTVALDNLQLFWPPAAALPFGTIGLAVRCAAAGVLVWAYHRPGGAEELGGGARRHRDFLLAIIAGMLLMPVVWEHYLMVLFVPLSYLVFQWRRLPHRALVVLVLVFAATTVQNVMILEWLRWQFTMNSPAEAVVTGLLKTVPLAFTAWLFLAYRRDIERSMARDEVAAAGAA